MWNKLSATGCLVVYKVYKLPSLTFKKKIIFDEEFCQIICIFNSLIQNLKPLEEYV
uniref:Uncharacterized protein n=1 Tax=Anguilla anguilla TaxID=7936 RepID=A0A0E9X9M7_ANGAN